MADDPELALVLKIIWRLIVVTFGFVAAILAAGTALALALSHDVMVAVETGAATAFDRQAISGFFLVIAFASFSFVPWAIGTIIAELLQFRSFLYHFGLGAISGAAASVLHPMPDPRSLQVAIATGLVAGGVYWLIAGRRAGDWWPRRVPPLSIKPPPSVASRPPPPPPDA